MPAASAQALRPPAQEPRIEQLGELLDAVGVPAAAGAWSEPDSAPAPPSPLFRHVPVGLQERESDNWLAWNVGRVRPDPFAILFDRYWRQISAFCFSIVGTRDEAEDAAAETMSRAFATLSRRQERPEFRPWIHAIARNAALDRLRQRNRGPRLAAVDEVLEVPVDETPGDVLGRRERLHGLVADMQELSERQRAAIVMRELSGMSHEEIAAALGTTPARSQALVADARQSLSARRAGREIGCDDYRRVVDTRGRLPRGHRLSAHRASCSQCRGYARPSVLSGVFFLPAIQLFSSAGRRIADVAGPTFAGVGPAGAAQVAAGLAVVAMAVPIATTDAPAKSGPAASEHRAPATAANAEPAAEGRGRHNAEAERSSSRSERRARKIAARKRERPSSSSPAPAETAKPSPSEPAAKPAPQTDPVTEIPDRLRQEVDRISEPVRRRAGELVDNLRGAVPAPPISPKPHARLPGTGDVGGLVP